MNLYSNHVIVHTKSASADGHLSAHLSHWQDRLSSVLTVAGLAGSTDGTTVTTGSCGCCCCSGAGADMTSDKPIGGCGKRDVDVY